MERPASPPAAAAADAAAATTPAAASPAPSSAGPAPASASPEAGPVAAGAAPAPALDLPRGSVRKTVKAALAGAAPGGGDVAVSKEALGALGECAKVYCWREEREGSNACGPPN